MKRSPKVRYQLLLGIATLAFLLTTGCAQKTTPETVRPVWPSPPDEPRIQFLASFEHSYQIEEQRSRLTDFLLGAEGKKPLKRFNKPWGVTSHAGKIYVADTMKGEVTLIDIAKKTWSRIGEAQELGKLFKKPIDLTCDSDGNLYVVDAKQKFIAVFDKEGAPKRQIGKGELVSPVSLAIWEDMLFVSDLKARKIVIFSRETGEKLESWGPTLGSGEDEYLGYPLGLAFGPDGVLNVIDGAWRRVFRLDRDGHFLGKIGHLGNVTGTFTRPKDLDVDNENHLWVVDSAFETVQVFDADGRILTYFGGPGDKPGNLWLPAGIDISGDNLDYWQKLARPDFQLSAVIFVISQYGPNRLSVYGYGHRKGVDPRKLEITPPSPDNES